MNGSKARGSRGLSPRSENCSRSRRRRRKQDEYPPPDTPDALVNAGKAKSLPHWPTKRHRACALAQATSTPDLAPDTGKEEKGTPRPPEAAVEGGRVRLDDKAPN